MMFSWPMAAATRSPRTTLAVGLRTIRVDGTDGLLTASDSVGINIEANGADAPPDHVLIKLPEDGSQYLATLVSAPSTYGYEVTLDGQAHDPEDGDLSGDSLTWTTAIDDGSGTITHAAVELGHGTSLTVTLAAPDCENWHNITLIAEDSAHNISSASIRVRVQVLCK